MTTKADRQSTPLTYPCNTRRTLSEMPSVGQDSAHTPRSWYIFPGHGKILQGVTAQRCNSEALDRCGQGKATLSRSIIVLPTMTRRQVLQHVVSSCRVLSILRLGALAVSQVFVTARRRFSTLGGVLFY